MSQSPAIELDRSPNRLSIAHLLLWIFIIAVQLALWVPDWKQRRTQSAQQRIDMSPVEAARLEREGYVWDAAHLLMLPLFAAGMVGVVLCARRQFLRQKTFPTTAGHWLLVAVGTLTIVTEINYRTWMWIVLPLLGSQPSQAALDRINIGWIVIEGLSALAPVAVLILGMRCAPGVWWKLVVGWFAAAMIIASLGQLLRLLAPDPSDASFPTMWKVYRGMFLAGAAAALVVWMSDRQKGIKNDIFHHIGIATVAGIGIVGIMRWFLLMIVR